MTHPKCAFCFVSVSVGFTLRRVRLLGDLGDQGKRVRAEGSGSVDSGVLGVLVVSQTKEEISIGAWCIQSFGS